MRVADHSGERPAWWALAAAALASFVLHLPFLTTPLSVDEGGYGYVARWWASGADLYGDIWVDRPQGLLLLYRWAEALPGSDRLDIRLMAALWSCAIAVVLGLLITQRGRPPRRRRGRAAQRPALDLAGDRGLLGQRRADGDAARARRARADRALAGARRAAR